ncbi:MAG: hypothetical protein LUG52_04245 [Clostridia bacterium]|nr:hypothetical protein [Clostridia bacterium]
MSKKKKHLSLTLPAALILAVITFGIGYLLPSVFLLDSRIESANEEIDSLKAEIRENESEISSLNKQIEQKDAANIILANTIEDHLTTIDSLNAQITELEGDVDFASQVAMNGVDSDIVVTSVSKLNSEQILIIFFALLVLLIFVVSVTCAIIASARRGAPVKEKKKDKKKKKKDEPEEETENESEESDAQEEAEAQEETETGESEPEPEEAEAQPEEESQTSEESDMPERVRTAIEYLAENKLEDSVTELNGFKFGVTNFDEILSNTAKGKTFGNSENGDFIAFMDSPAAKKLYIIPRYTALSDSAVTLRGTVDLFDLADESGNAITSGAVKIKSVNAPAVFSFGEIGWAIETKGSITVL